jgi:hypothetical protein
LFSPFTIYSELTRRASTYVTLHPHSLIRANKFQQCGASSDSDIDVVPGMSYPPQPKLHHCRV